MLKYHILKFLKSLALPPGIFILFLLFASLFAKRFRRFFLFLTLLAYIFSTQFVGNLLLKPLEEPYKTQKFSPSTSLVVVLGGGYFDGRLNLPLSHSSFKRAIYGYKLTKRLKLPLLYNGSQKECENAKKTFLEVFGDDSFIIYENRALNTKENAFYTKKYLQEHNLTNSIYLVTSAFHMRRAIREFKKLDIKVQAIATDFRSSSELCYCNFYPTIEGIKLCYTALHEYLALLVEYVKK